MSSGGNGGDMLRVLNCVVYEHDLRLVAISAIICALGCFTSDGAGRSGGRERPQRCPALAGLRGRGVRVQRLVAPFRGHAGLHPGRADGLRRGTDGLVGRGSLRRRIDGAARLAGSDGALGPGRSRRPAARAGDQRHALCRRGGYDVLGVPDLRPDVCGGLGDRQRRVLHRGARPGSQPEDDRATFRSRRMAGPGDLRPPLHRHDGDHRRARRGHAGRRGRSGHAARSHSRSAASASPSCSPASPPSWSSSTCRGATCATSVA